MKVYKENSFKGGWFLGNFTPSIFVCKDFEVAVKRYKSGDYEKKHLHKLADEITFIVEGKVKMNNVIYEKGDIILIEKNESTDFECLEDATTVVVKIPSVIGDKYVIE